MSTKIASVHAEISADTTKLQKGLADTKSGLSQFKNNLNSTVQSLTGFNLAQVGVAAAVGFATKEFLKALDATVGYAEQVRDLGRISGASSEQTSRLIQTADDLKVSYETLTMAAKTAATKGIALTTENLAKLSDQYKAIPDAAGRSAFALEKFGRAGLEMTKVLELGSDAIKELAAAQGGNLILTEQQVKQAREFEKAQDALNDTLTGFKYAIGNAVLPAITSLIKGLDELINREERLKQKQQAEIDIIYDTSKGYEEYKQRIDELNGPQIQYQNNLAKQYGASTRANEAVKAMSEALYDLGKFVIPEVTWQTDQLASATDDAGIGAKLLAQYQKEEKDALDSVNDSMRELTKEMFYNKAAAGLDADAALALARSMGILNEDTYYAYQRLAGIREEYQSGKITADQYKAAVIALGQGIALLPRETHIKILQEIQTTYSGGNSPFYTPPGGQTQYAGGGSFIVPPGYVENYPLGYGKTASSGERVEVTPAGNSKDANGKGVVININGITDPYKVARQVKQIMARY